MENKVKDFDLNLLGYEKTTALFEELIKNGDEFCCDKLEDLRKNHKVMMIGDGINDAPALANSDIGVSISGGTDIALDSSDIIIMKDDLEKIVTLFEFSNKTIRIIKENLFWAFLYNSLMIPIAIGLLKPMNISISPMLASIAMTISSLTVILNSLRLKKI